MGRKKRPLASEVNESSKTDLDCQDLKNCQDYTTKNEDLSKKKGRHFGFVVYPSEEFVINNYSDCNYAGEDGWGEAPDNWIERLKETGLSFCVSPLHYKDVNPDGTIKKPHWHIIVSWSNTTTYNNAIGLCELLKCPKPKKIESVTGMYKYLTHQDNPEKYQYEDKPKSYNGFIVPLESEDIVRIKRELLELIFTEDLREYSTLMLKAMLKGEDYFQVATSNTIFFNSICRSYRHNPSLALKYAVSNNVFGDEMSKILSERLLGESEEHINEN